MLALETIAALFPLLEQEQELNLICETRFEGLPPLTLEDESSC
jgi:hypothetical protein